MAVASCAWITKRVQGNGPSPRQGHAAALSGNKIFVFGGLSTSKDGQDSEFHNDLYSLTVDAEEITWNKIPHQGEIPSRREGHNLCSVQKKLYLFGGRGDLDAFECLPGLYSFDIKSSTWSLCVCNGNAPFTMNSTMCAIGKTLFVFGGIYDSEASNDLFMCHVDNLLWTPLKVSGDLPSPRCDHCCTVVNDKMFIFGGCGGESTYYNDVFAFDTVTLSWQEISVKGDPPFPRGCHSFTAHHDKDIFVFGGYNDNHEMAHTGFSDLYKLSLNKFKWKRPLYTGILAEKRSSHVAVILHSHLYVIGGLGDSEQLDDVSILKLINPSDRKPIFKDIMMDLGISSKSTEFIPTKRPQYDYDMNNPPYTQPTVTPVTSSDEDVRRDLSSIREMAKESVDKAISALEEQFSKLDRERSEFTAKQQAAEQEFEEYKQLYASQQRELQSMIEQHESVNEDWLEQRRMENDQERKDIASQRARLLADQEKLVHEQEDLSAKTRHLHSVMQQFKHV